MSNILEILDKFALYSKYDANQTSFNLLTFTYDFHQIGKTITHILQDYDNTGNIAVVYAKKNFQRLMQQQKVSLWTIVASPESFQAEADMFQLFASEDVQKAENEITEWLQSMYCILSDNKQLAALDSKMVDDYALSKISDIVHGLNRCNVDVFRSGDIIQPIRKINKTINVFETTAACLLNIEQQEDGLYLCYINAGYSAEAHFCFMLKSNSNIISINDRVDEAFIGQHGHSRNGRWTDKKTDAIFPYDHLFTYSDYDYKGYAQKYYIDSSKLDIYNLGPEVYMPIMLAVLLISNKYIGKKLNQPITYIDSFLPMNAKQIASHALMPITGSNIVLQHADIDLNFDVEKVINGEYSAQFGWRNRNQLLVDLWGKGFEFHRTKDRINNVSCLIAGDTEVYVPEFIGDEKRMQMQAYQEIRKQLAEYMEDNIYSAWVEFGKTPAIKKWYHNALLAEENKNHVFRLFMEAEQDACGKKGFEHFEISVSDGPYPSDYKIGRDSYLHCYQEQGNASKYIDVDNHKQCSRWFIIKPTTWAGIERLTQSEVPDVVKGWLKHGHTSDRNHLLQATDPVEFVSTPCEHRYERDMDARYYQAGYDFCVAFGFSKRNWSAIKKSLSMKPSTLKEKIKNAQTVDLFDDFSAEEKEQIHRKGTLTAMMLSKRYDKTLSKQELAECLGVSMDVVEKLEDGEMDISDSFFEEINQKLNNI